MHNFFLNKKRSKERSYRERGLWRAVILQAFVDSLTKSKRTEEKLARSSARGWLLGMSYEFKLVCSMAGYEPNQIKKRAQKFMNQGKQLADLIRVSK